MQIRSQRNKKALPKQVNGSQRKYIVRKDNNYRTKSIVQKYKRWLLKNLNIRYVERCSNTIVFRAVGIIFAVVGEQYARHFLSGMLLRTQLQFQLAKKRRQGSKWYDTAAISLCFRYLVNQFICTVSHEFSEVQNNKKIVWTMRTQQAQYYLLFAWVTRTVFVEEQLITI